MLGDETLEDDDLGLGDDDLTGDEVESQPVATKDGSEARRRLEERLEAKRLEKLISDFDYDFD